MPRISTVLCLSIRQGDNTNVLLLQNSSGYQTDFSRLFNKLIRQKTREMTTRLLQVKCPQKIAIFPGENFSVKLLCSGRWEEGRRAK